MSTLTLSKRKLSLKTLTFTIGFAAMATLLGTTAYAADPEKKLEDQAAQIEATASEMQVTPPVEATVEGEAEAAQDGDAAPSEVMPSEDSKKIAAGTESEAVTEPITKQTAKSDNCFTQADGSVECICVSAEACEELLASETCEADTAWQKDDGYGGCTQKQPE